MKLPVGRTNRGHGGGRGETFSVVVWRELARGRTMKTERKRLIVWRSWRSWCSWHRSVTGNGQPWQTGKGNFVMFLGPLAPFSDPCYQPGSHARTYTALAFMRLLTSSVTRTAGSAPCDAALLFSSVILREPHPRRLCREKRYIMPVVY